jgi:hypothetical protein
MGCVALTGGRIEQVPGHGGRARERLKPERGAERAAANLTEPALARTADPC